MVYAQHGIRPGEWDAQITLGFWDTNLNLCGSQKKKKKRKRKKEKRNCRIMNITIPADHGVKIKASERKDKYIAPVWEL